MPVPMAASLSGSFGWFHMADVLQAIGITRRPSKISVIDGCELVSNIYVDGDLVVDAVTGGVSTPRAFFRAMDVKADGRFTVHRMARMPERPPLATLTAMILEYSARRRAGHPDLFETGMEQGIGRTAPGEVFLEGWLGDYPLEDVIPALVHPDRASRMTLSIQGMHVGTISIVGRYIGPCDYRNLKDMTAFYAMFCVKPAKCFFRVERIPIDQVADSALIGPVNQLLIGAVVNRDELAAGVGLGSGVHAPLEAFPPVLVARPVVASIS